MTTLQQFGLGAAVILIGYLAVNLALSGAHQLRQARHIADLHVAASTRTNGAARLLLAATFAATALFITQSIQ